MERGRILYFSYAYGDLVLYLSVRWIANMRGLGDSGFVDEEVWISPFIDIILFSNAVETNKGGIIPKPLPMKLILAKRRGKGQSTVVPGPWTVPNKMGLWYHIICLYLSIHRSNI